MVDYTNLFTSYPSPQALLLLFLLGLFRFLPIILQAPFFGAKIIPGPVKMGLAISLVLVYLPQMLFYTSAPLAFNGTYIALVIKELVVGLILGLFVSVPFYMVLTAGNLIDHQRGTASLQMQDPTLGAQGSPIGILFNYLLIYIFYLTGGFYFFLESIALSYQLIPPDVFLPSLLFTSEKFGFWQDIIHLGNEILSIGIRLAAPALVALFMSDLFLGIANRMATQVPMTFLGWALKSLVAVGVLYIAWTFILAQFDDQTNKWLKHINQVIEEIASPATPITGRPV